MKISYHVVELKIETQLCQRLVIQLEFNYCQLSLLLKTSSKIGSCDSIALSQRGALLILITRFVLSKFQVDLEKLELVSLRAKLGNLGHFTRSGGKQGEANHCLIPMQPCCQFQIPHSHLRNILPCTLVTFCVFGHREIVDGEDREANSEVKVVKSSG